MNRHLISLMLDFTSNKFNPSLGTVISDFGWIHTARYRRRISSSARKSSTLPLYLIDPLSMI